MRLGLGVNAGHGLNYQNLAALRQVPHLVELNIGHSIVSRAIVVGLAAAVQRDVAGDGKNRRRRRGSLNQPFNH